VVESVGIVREVSRDSVRLETEQDQGDGQGVRKRRDLA